MMQGMGCSSKIFVRHVLRCRVMYETGVQRLMAPARRSFCARNGDHDDFWQAVKTEAQTTPAHKSATANLSSNKGTVEWAAFEREAPPLPAGEAYGPYSNASSPKTAPSEQYKPDVFDLSSPMHLSGNKEVRVRRFNDTVLVDIRSFFNNEGGDIIPTKKGIALTIPQWKRLKAAVRDIDVRVQEFEQRDSNV